MRLGAIVVLLLLLLAPWPVAGEPIPLSDEELDQVTAQGAKFTLDLKRLIDEQLLEFFFDTGGAIFGNGTVGFENGTPGPTAPLFPSNLTIQGNPDLSHSQFFVETLNFQINICVCQGNNINVGNYVVPVKFQPQGSQ